MYQVATVDRDTWVLKSVRKFDTLDDAIVYTKTFPEYGNSVPLVTNGRAWFNAYFEEEAPPVVLYPGMGN